MNIKEILKIDLDFKSKKKSINLLNERLKFLNEINILPIKYIIKIELIKKNNYSAKIYLKKSLKDKKDIIILQSILGTDYKHTSITFRDFKLNIQNYNRLFDIKRYPDGSYKKAKIFDISKEILSI